MTSSNTFDAGYDSFLGAFSTFLLACRAGDVRAVEAGLARLGTHVHKQNDLATRTAISNRHFRVANLIMRWCMQHDHPVVLGTLSTFEMTYRMVMAPTSTLRLCVAGHLMANPNRVRSLNFSQLLQCAVLNAKPYTVRWLWGLYRLVAARQHDQQNDQPNDHIGRELSAAIRHAQNRSVWLWNVTPNSRLGLFDQLSGTTLGFDRLRCAMSRRLFAAATLSAVIRRAVLSMNVVMMSQPGSFAASRARASFYRE